MDIFFVSFAAYLFEYIPTLGMLCMWGKSESNLDVCIDLY